MPWSIYDDTFRGLRPRLPSGGLAGEAAEGFLGGLGGGIDAAVPLYAQALRDARLMQERERMRRAEWLHGAQVAAAGAGRAPLDDLDAQLADLAQAQRAEENWKRRMEQVKAQEERGRWAREQGTREVGTGAQVAARIPSAGPEADLAIRRALTAQFGGVPPQARAAGAVFPYGLAEGPPPPKSDVYSPARMEQEKLMRMWGRGRPPQGPDRLNQAHQSLLNYVSKFPPNPTPQLQAQKEAGVRNMAGKFRGADGKPLISPDEAVATYAPVSRPEARPSLYEAMGGLFGFGASQASEDDEYERQAAAAAAGGAQ